MKATHQRTPVHIAGSNYRETITVRDNPIKPIDI